MFYITCLSMTFEKKDGRWFSGVCWNKSYCNLCRNIARCSFYVTECNCTNIPYITFLCFFLYKEHIAISVISFLACHWYIFVYMVMCMYHLNLKKLTILDQWATRDLLVYSRMRYHWTNTPKCCIIIKYNVKIVKYNLICQLI